MKSRTDTLKIESLGRKETDSGKRPGFQRTDEVPRPTFVTLNRRRVGWGLRELVTHYLDHTFIGDLPY